MAMEKKILQYISTCSDCGATLQAGWEVRAYKTKEGKWKFYCNDPKTHQKLTKLNANPTTIQPKGAGSKAPSPIMKVLGMESPAEEAEIERRINARWDKAFEMAGNYLDKHDELDHSLITQITIEFARELYGEAQTKSIQKSKMGVA